VPSRRIRSRIALLLGLVLAVAACAAEAPAPSAPDGAKPSTLEGSSWLVVAVNGRTPVVGTKPALAFEAGGKIQGSGGCNGLGGSFAFDPATGRFAVAELGMTLMGCQQAGVSDFETVFLQALGAASQASLDDTGRLLLGLPGGEIVLVPDRAVP
jgi:putative lipoprotein